MVDRVLIPLPGIGTLSLTRAEYDAALIPMLKPEVPTSPKKHTNPSPPANFAKAIPLGRRYIRLREVCARVGVGSSTIYAMIATGEFPKQVKPSSRTAAWVESEVDEFMNARIAERDEPIPVSVQEVSPYMRMGEVMRLTGMTHAMIYDGVRTKTFPKWADLPKRGSGWLKADVESWLGARDRGQKG